MTRLYRKLSVEDKRQIKRVFAIIASHRPTADRIAALLPHLNATTIAAFLNRDMPIANGKPNAVTRRRFRYPFSPEEDRRILQLFDEYDGRMSKISATISREGVRRSAETVFNRIKKLRSEMSSAAGPVGFPPSPAAGLGEGVGSYPARPPHSSSEGTA